MLSKILVPMDDSAHAEHALRYAIENHPDAEVTVLHVVGVPSMMMGDAVGLVMEDDFEDAAATRAQPVFDRADAIAEEMDRDIETVIGFGHPAKNIIERATDYETVILGSHGADRSRATRRFLVGNIAETVVKRSPVPVTIVR